MHSHLRLLRYAAPYRAQFAGLAVMTLLTSGVAALQPWPMKLVVDHVLGSAPLPGWLTSTLAGLGLPGKPLVVLALGAVGGLVLFGLSSALEVALTSGWTMTGRRLVYDLAGALFARLLRRSVTFHSRTPVGDLMNRITGDSWCVYQIMDGLGFAVAHALLTTVLMLWLMLQLDPFLAGIALVTAPLTVGASFLVGRPLHLAAKLRREIEGRIQAHVQQTLTGIPVVQAFGQEAREQQRLEQFADDVIRAQQRTVLFGSLNSLSSGLVTTLGAGVVLWFGAQHVISGSLTLGGLLVFLVYLTSLQGQTRQLAGAYTTYRTTGASVERVSEWLDAVPEVVERPQAPALGPVKGHLTMEGVTFGYETGRPVLHAIALEVHPGQTVALVGPTGAGKSTLAHLVPRFFDPWEGRVRVDGRDLRDVRLDSLRSQVALVLQEPFLFPTTIAENIALGQAGASREEIEAAARIANADEFIRRLPEGYDTVIGERGSTLSGGERQRLSIARAVLRDAPILILDEPSSALDAVTEQSVFEALDRLRSGRTTLVIAHRLSTVRHADCILVLKDGRIVERGTHEALLSAGGFYARLQALRTAPTVDRVSGTLSA